MNLTFSPSDKSFKISLDLILFNASLLSKFITKEIAFNIVVFPEAFRPINEIV